MDLVDPRIDELMRRVEPMGGVYGNFFEVVVVVVVVVFHLRR